MLGIKRGKMRQFCNAYEPEQLDQLERLQRATRIPVAEFLREALQDLLKKHEDKLESKKRSK